MKTENDIDKYSKFSNVSLALGIVGIASFIIPIVSLLIAMIAFIISIICFIKKERNWQAITGFVLGFVVLLYNVMILITLFSATPVQYQ